MVPMTFLFVIKLMMFPPSKLDTETKNRATGGLAKNPYKEYSKATEQEYGFNNMYASSSRNYRDIRDMR